MNQMQRTRSWKLLVEYLEDQVAQTGHVPTQSDMARVAGLSLGGIQYALVHLRQRGSMSSGLVEALKCPVRPHGAQQPNSHYAPRCSRETADRIVSLVLRDPGARQALASNFPAWAI